MVENLDHFMVEDKAFFGFLCRYEFREILEYALKRYGDNHRREFGFRIIKDGLDAFLDLLESDGLRVRKGLGLAHWF
jgi:hypothetical protein